MRKGIKWSLVVLVASCLPVSMLVISGCYPPGIDVDLDSTLDVTASQTMIHEGMTEGEVIAILGEPMISTHNMVNGVEMAGLIYVDEKDEGLSLTVSLRDGVVDDISVERN